MGIWNLCSLYTFSIEVGSCIAVQVCLLQIPILVLANLIYVSFHTSSKYIFTEITTIFRYMDDNVILCCCFLAIRLLPSVSRHSLVVYSFCPSHDELRLPRWHFRLFSRWGDCSAIRIHCIDLCWSKSSRSISSLQTSQ